jgi:hypothetical protein
LWGGVQVIKFELNGICIDMIFVNLACDMVPQPLNLFSDEYLAGLDKAGVRSLNGVRTTRNTYRTQRSLHAYLGYTSMSCDYERYFVIMITLLHHVFLQHDVSEIQQH